MPPVRKIQEVTHAQSLQCLAEIFRVGYFFKCLWAPHQPRNPPFHAHVLAKFAPRLYHSKPMGEQSCGGVVQGLRDDRSASVLAKGLARI
jgi:hypothetical protein